MVTRALKLVFTLSIFFMFSCKSNNDNTLELLTSRLEISNDYLKNNVSDINDDFINLKHDPKSQNWAMKFSSIIDTLKILIDNYIINLEAFNNTNNLNVELPKIVQSNKNLNTFFNSIFLNSNFIYQEDDLKFIKIQQTDLIDSAIEKHFKNISNAKTKTYTVAIINKLLIFEYEFIKHFVYKSTGVMCGYENINVFINQNATHLKFGENLDLKIAINTSSFSNKPIVTIKNKTFTSIKEGVVSCTTEIAGKPGVYNLPLLVSYIKPDGILAIMAKEIKYTIDE